MRPLFLLLTVSLFFFSCREKESKQASPPAQNEANKPSKPVFTDTTACVFSEIAYCPDPQARLDSFLPGWKIVWNPLAVGGNYAFVATDGGTYVIAFRGSLISFTEAAFSNWIYNDLNIVVQDKWPYTSVEKARISQGSFIGWQNLEKMKDKISGKSLWAFLSETLTEKNPLILTGHSLGGNLAMVYASYLWWKFNEAGQARNNINAITFAAPAPGNAAFANDFDTKFPLSVRVENTNDIVPKFPVSERIAELGKLYTPSPSASSVSIGYRNVTTGLGQVFTLIRGALIALELTSSFSGYEQTNGDGRLISIPLSGRNTNNTAADWFAEAGYQHGMAQYARMFGAPVICD